MKLSAKPIQIAARFVFWWIAAFYAYGALVHVLNMLSLTGFDWLAAPLKWQILDLVYLVLDDIVVIGLVQMAWYGIVAFYAAAVSQICLYTLLRDWILDVPDAFQPTPEQVSYLNVLVGFHLISLLVFTGAVIIRAQKERTEAD